MFLPFFYSSDILESSQPLEFDEYMEQKLDLYQALRMRVKVP